MPAAIVRIRLFCAGARADSFRLRNRSMMRVATGVARHGNRPKPLQRRGAATRRDPARYGPKKSNKAAARLRSATPRRKRQGRFSDATVRLAKRRFGGIEIGFQTWRPTGFTASMGWGKSRPPSGCRPRTIRRRSRRRKTFAGTARASCGRETGWSHGSSTGERTKKPRRSRSSAGAASRRARGVPTAGSRPPSPGR